MIRLTTYKIKLLIKIKKIGFLIIIKTFNLVYYVF